MNNDKSIKLYKKSFLSRIIDFFKGVFNNSPKELGIVEQETNENVKYNENSVFLDSIKLNQEDVDPTELQIKFESNEINFDSMSNEEIHSLNVLYRKQVESLRKQIDNKKTELNMLKFKTTNSLTN